MATNPIVSSVPGGRNSSVRRRAALAAGALAASIRCAAPAGAQTVVFTSQIGENTAACGPAGGPFIDHQFVTPVGVHDDISVSDPGGGVRPPTAAAARLDATTLPRALRISLGGESERGAAAPQGGSAVADGRDSWGFTLSAATPFTMVVSLQASSNEATPVTPGGFNFLASAGGRMDLVGGGSVTGLTQALTAPGSWSATYTGTLRPGHYDLDTFGHSEGSQPNFSGSYADTLTLNMCPADFNVDGAANSQDFFDFLAEFFAGTAAADFNGDGAVNSQDFFDFLGAFFVGC